MIIMAETTSMWNCTSEKQPDLDVVNSTIAANTSIGKSGAGIKNMGSNIEILNSVISLNARDNRSS